MRRTLIFCALLSASPGLWAADWVKLVIPNTSDQYFYDRSKLVIQGSEVTYWKKVIFNLPQAVKTQFAKAGLMRERINCKEHTLRLLSYLYQDAQGVVFEYVAESEKEGAAIIPESVGDWYEQALCASVVSTAPLTEQDSNDFMPPPKGGAYAL